MNKKLREKQPTQDCKTSKFAAGGVAKIRHEQSTKDGKQKEPKK